MRICRSKLDLELAKQCKTVTDLRNALSSATLTRIRQGSEVSTRSAGKLAKALNVPVEQLIEQEVRA